MSESSQANCHQESGVVVPVIDRNQCEGKADCVRVCPYQVFEIRKLTAEQRSALSLRGKIKAFAHGNKQAFLANPDNCHACGLCVDACPEQALTLDGVAF